MGYRTSRLLSFQRDDVRCNIMVLCVTLGSLGVSGAGREIRLTARYGAHPYQPPIHQAQPTEIASSSKYLSHIGGKLLLSFVVLISRVLSCSYWRSFARRGNWARRNTSRTRQQTCRMAHRCLSTE